MARIHDGAKSGNIADVKRLLRKSWWPFGRTNVNERDERGNSPLHYAASQGHCEIAKFLSEAGADVNARNHEGATPLHVAAYSGCTTSAKLLIELGADVSIKDQLGQTALYPAALLEHRQLMQVLVEHGAVTEDLSKLLVEQIFQREATDGEALANNLIKQLADRYAEHNATAPVDDSSG